MNKPLKLTALTICFALAALLCGCANDPGPDTGKTPGGGSNTPTPPPASKVEYTLEGSEYTLSKVNDTTLTAFTVPEVYEGKAVTKIAAGAFQKSTYITSLTIPSSVKEIAVSALGGLGALKELTIPYAGLSASAEGEQGLFGAMFGQGTYTGGTAVEQAFSEAEWDVNTYYIPTNLATVTVTGSRIAPYAFGNCTMIKTVRLGSGVTTVGDHAFDGNAFTAVKVDSAAVAEGLSSAEALGALLSNNPTLFVAKNITTVNAWVDSAYKNKADYTENDVEYSRYGNGGEFRLEAELAELAQGLNLEAPAVASGGYSVGGFDSVLNMPNGAYMIFRFNSDIATQAKMSFVLNPRGSQDYCSDTFTITLNGKEVHSDAQFVCDMSTWNWYVFETFFIANVDLQKGANELKIEFHGNNGEPGSDRETTVDNGHNFDYVLLDSDATISWIKQ